MSLTEWIHFSRYLIDLLYDKPPFTLKEQLQAPPLTNHYGTVGTAFDYAMRLLIMKLNHDFVTDFPLVARHGVLGNRKRQHFITSFDEKRQVFLSNKLQLDNLLPDCIVLAKLESVFRSGLDYPNSEIFYADEKDVKDLKNLVSLVDHNLFIAKKQCVLNPTFGQSSEDLGGADADLIIDGILLDIKTIKNLEFKREYFRQLIGYHILNLREKQMYGEFRRLGIYFSRFGILFTFSIPEKNKLVLKATNTPVDFWEAIEESIREYQNA